MSNKPQPKTTTEINETQRILVTGASSGIGLAICEELLSVGYEVHGVARDFSKCALQHESFIRHGQDLARSSELPGFIKALLKTHAGSWRALVNNAGQGKMAALEQLSYGDIEHLMGINFLSHAFISKAMLPTLKQQAHADVIFIGSESAVKGGQQGSVYCASKFALRGFSQSLREECAKSSVRISLINPGAVNTAFFDSLNFKPGESEENYIEPIDVAKAVAMVVAARPGTVFDEINLSPQKKVWQKNNRLPIG